MTVVEAKEFESVETLQSLFRDPEAQEHLADLGVRTALVATWDGLLIDAVVCDDEPVELEMLAANAAAALQLSHADRPVRGRADGIISQLDGGSTIIVDPVGENSLVAFVAKPAADVAQLRTELRALAKLRIADNLTPAAAATPDKGIRGPDAATGPASRPAAPAVHEIVKGTPAGRRVILKEVTLDTTGHAATATVVLSLNGRNVIGKAVARNDQTQHLVVAAEATVRAVSELLPDGYGVVLEHITSLASPLDQSIRAVSVKVLFLTPAGEQTLLGIAKLAGNEPVAAAKTVLSAVNASIELLIGQISEHAH